MDTEFSLHDYEQVRGRLICRLVHADNMYLWRKTVWAAAFADLYAIPCIYRIRTDGTADCCPVSFIQAAGWGIAPSRLKEDAVESMRRAFPATLDRMDDLMESGKSGSVSHVFLKLLKKRFPDSPDDKLGQVARILARRVGQRAKDAGGLMTMWVLSNTEGRYGASSVLYPGVLDCFAREVKSGFYILPSSINDVILLPEGGSETREMLYGMVDSANRKIKDQERVLSGSVYYFDRNTMRICLF